MITKWLNEDLLKTIVLFEIPNQKGELVPHGTGVLINYHGVFIVVTCKHIVLNLQSKELYKGLVASINKTDGTVTRRSIESIHKQFKCSWLFHKNEDVDLALSIMGLNESEDDIKLIGQDLLEDFNSIPLGEDIFFLGYPHGLGVSKDNKLTPLVRVGMVSLKTKDMKFLIDANVYPGSSGGPVFYRPTIASFEKANLTLGAGRGFKLLGIVSDNLNYVEDAVSARTGLPRVSFQENAGLGVVQSTTLLKEMFDYKELVDLMPKKDEVKALKPAK